MFGIGSTELILILVVALIVIGPSKLPEIMRAVGKGMAEFKRMSNDVQSTLKAEMDRVEQEEKKAEAKKDLFPEEDKAQTAEAKPEAAAEPKKEAKAG